MAAAELMMVAESAAGRRRDRDAMVGAKSGRDSTPELGLALWVMLDHDSQIRRRVQLTEKVVRVRFCLIGRAIVA